MSKKILVTGAAGFIGFHLVNALAARGDQIVGIDNINDYYSTDLKFARLLQAGIERDLILWNTPVISKKLAGYRFIRMNLEDKTAIMELCGRESFDAIVNFGAQAGVRYSIDNPDQYIQANIVGFFNILEASRHHRVGHLIYASSSSVYGNNSSIPFSINQQVDQPISLYAATKKSNELMAYTYSHLFGIPTTGLRFFTVYGPWGRPDMAYYLFCDAIMKGDPIKVFNQGDMKRDFTYIDDIVAGIIGAIDIPPAKDQDAPPYRIFNLGNNQPVQLMTFIEELERNLGKKAVKNYLDMQEGDVKDTWADIEQSVNVLGYSPETSIHEGIKRFVDWYRTYSQLTGDHDLP